MGARTPIVPLLLETASYLVAYTLSPILFPTLFECSHDSVVYLAVFLCPRKSLVEAQIIIRKKPQ